MIKHCLTIFCLTLILALESSDRIEKPMVVIIPSYNNEEWIEKNLISVFQQKYTNYRVIYIDDKSTDNTAQKVENLISDWNMSERVQLKKNKENQGAMKNFYDAIHSCEDDEIIVNLDGDDWLTNPRVLNTINKAYSKKREVWLTHGSYVTIDGHLGIDRSASFEIVQNNLFRDVFQVSHLRTYYAWLFKKIRKEDLMYKNKFLTMACDLAMMFPMLEMAGSRHAYISKILYIYNTDNPINDHKKDRQLQLFFDRYIRQKNKYKPLDLLQQ